MCLENQKLCEAYTDHIYCHDSRLGRLTRAQYFNLFSGLTEFPPGRKRLCGVLHELRPIDCLDSDTSLSCCHGEKARMVVRVGVNILEAEKRLLPDLAKDYRTTLEIADKEFTQMDLEGNYLVPETENEQVENAMTAWAARELNWPVAVVKMAKRGKIGPAVELFRKKQKPHSDNVMEIKSRIEPELRAVLCVKDRIHDQFLDD